MSFELGGMSLEPVTTGYSGGPQALKRESLLCAFYGTSELVPLPISAFCPLGK